VLTKDRLTDLKMMAEIAKTVLDSLPEPEKITKDFHISEARADAIDILRAIISEVGHEVLDSKD
jgi:hypothetical protein